MGAVLGQSQRAGQDGGTKEGGGGRRLRVLLFDLVRERDRVREGSEMGQKGGAVLRTQRDAAP
jgi:hypothetical protein